MPSSISDQRFGAIDFKLGRRRETPSLEAGLSVRKWPGSGTCLSNSYVERPEVPSTGPETESLIRNVHRNMGVNNTANTCGGSREMLPADAESGRVGRNVRRRLTTTEPVMFGNVGRLPTAANASVLKPRKRTREDVRAAGNNQTRTNTVQKTTAGSVNTLPTADEQHPNATHITRNLDMADGGGVPIIRNPDMTDGTSVEAEKLAFYVVQSSNGFCSLRYVAEGRWSAENDDEDFDLKDGDSLMEDEKLKDAMPFYERAMDKLVHQSRCLGIYQLEMAKWVSLGVGVGWVASQNGSFFGSVKTFGPALSVMNDTEEKGLFTPEKTVLVEHTSGNMGISMAFMAALKVYRILLIGPSTQLERIRGDQCCHWK
ncbi:bifunctional L-3-cyanoalanine synthase/cysteine synthase 1, mitochondrial [Tanacetum coccineum]